MAEVKGTHTCFAASARNSPLGLVSLPKSTSPSEAPSSGIFSFFAKSSINCFNSQKLLIVKQNLLANKILSKNEIHQNQSS